MTTPSIWRIAESARRLFFVSLVSLSSCAAPEPSVPLIFRGDPVERLSPVARSVVALVHQSPSGAVESFCSGVLISSTQLLTAAHCQDRLPFHLFFGLDTSKPTQGELKTVIAQKPYLSGNAFYGDLAIMTFTGPAPEEARPAQIVPAGTAVEIGLNLFVAGFGRTERGDRGLLSTAPATISQLIPLHALFESEHLTGSGPCRGDSGGPAFYLNNGTLVVVGLVSGGTGACGAETVTYTNLAHYRDWIAATKR